MAELLTEAERGEALPALGETGWGAVRGPGRDPEDLEVPQLLGSLGVHDAGGAGGREAEPPPGMDAISTMWWT